MFTAVDFTADEIRVTVFDSGQGFDFVKLYSFLSMTEFNEAIATAQNLSLYTAGHIPFAVGLELVQKRIPRREFDVTDMLANITGIFLGLASYELSRRLG